MRRTLVSFALAVALMLPALPLAASPVVGAESPGSVWSLAAAKVLNAFAGLWGVVAPEVAASPAPGARAKDGEDSDGRVDAPPLDGLGAGVDVNG